jgi:hypothetical protein
MKNILLFIAVLCSVTAVAENLVLRSTDEISDALIKSPELMRAAMAAQLSFGRGVVTRITIPVCAKGKNSTSEAHLVYADSNRLADPLDRVVSIPCGTF